MVNIIFKNVGQGDSIILEWTYKGIECVGIIDANLYNGSNPVLEYLKHKSNFKLKFIVLSHLHLDHFSGLAEIFEYCKKSNIKIEKFYHTILQQLGILFDEIFTSMRLNSATTLFIKSFDENESIFGEIISIDPNISNFIILDGIEMSFLAPDGRELMNFSKQLSRKRNKLRKTYADINRLATIVELKSDSESFLFTSDAVRKSFSKNKKRITNSLQGAQIPHHGSKSNFELDFWEMVTKKQDAKAIFSVGDNPKDKLPNIETVKYFDKSGYKVLSTNNVYGISEYFGNQGQDQFKEISQLLTLFSNPRIIQKSNIINDYQGDKKLLFS